MRTVIAVTSVVILIGVIVAGAVVSRPARAQGTARHPLVTKAEYERWQTDLSERLQMSLQRIRASTVMRDIIIS